MSLEAATGPNVPVVFLYSCWNTQGHAALDAGYKRRATMQMSNTVSPAAESYRRENERQTVRAELDEALEDTFPGSDPVSATRATTPGKATLQTIDNEDFRAIVESRIRARPFAAVALAAGLGFIFGLKR
jgi:ElaB/YqjD/DUF883 family membrane-anchored ribosome-binding protein